MLGLIAEIRRDVAAAQTRDPAARGVAAIEILATWPGVHALLAHRIAHALYRRSGAARSARDRRRRAIGHRDRDPPGGEDRRRLLHRPRDGRRDRRDGRDRRQRDALPGRDAGRHRVCDGQAPSRPCRTTSRSDRARSCSARSPSVTARRSAPTASSIHDVPPNSTVVGVPGPPGPRRGSSRRGSGRRLGAPARPDRGRDQEPREPDRDAGARGRPTGRRERRERVRRGDARRTRRSSGQTQPAGSAVSRRSARPSSAARAPTRGPACCAARGRDTAADP